MGEGGPKHKFGTCLAATRRGEGAQEEQPSCLDPRMTKSFGETSKEVSRHGGGGKKSVARKGKSSHLLMGLQGGGGRETKN